MQYLHSLQLRVIQSPRPWHGQTKTGNGSCHTSLSMCKAVPTFSHAIRFWFCASLWCSGFITTLISGHVHIVHWSRCKKSRFEVIPKYVHVCGSLYSYLTMIAYVPIFVQKVILPLFDFAIKVTSQLVEQLDRDRERCTLCRLVKAWRKNGHTCTCVHGQTCTMLYPLWAMSNVQNNWNDSSQQTHGRSSILEHLCCTHTNCVCLVLPWNSGWERKRVRDRSMHA